MAERPEDLNLPITVVQRIIKEALPDGVIVSKEARQSISRAASVFVLYLTACAVTHSNKAKRKTLAVNDILSAMTEMEFDSFITPLNEALKNRKEALSATAKKPASKSTKPNETGEQDEEADDAEPEVVEIEDSEVAEMEDENDDAEDEKQNEQSPSGKPNVKKRKLTDKEDESKNVVEEEKNEEEEVEEESDGSKSESEIEEVL